MSGYCRLSSPPAKAWKKIETCGIFNSISQAFIPFVSSRADIGWSDAVVKTLSSYVMVRLVDLDENGREEEFLRNNSNVLASSDDRPNPNFSLRFSAALSCYP